jgi:polyferredoxin
MSFVATYKRRSVQTLSLLLLHSSWGPDVKWLCNPVLSCHSCVLAWFACPIGVFVHYSSYLMFPFLAVGTLLLIGVVFGRMLCGWVCPFGFLLDLLFKIPTPKFALPQWTSFIKYGVLVGAVLLIPGLLGQDTLYSFCRVCPASAIQVTIPNLITGGTSAFNLLTAVKLGLLAAVLLLAVFSSRSFCKVVCPIGALMGPLNYISFWAIRHPAKFFCTACAKCNNVCPADGMPYSRLSRNVPPNRSQDCLVCHDCQTFCPQKDRQET